MARHCSLRPEELELWQKVAETAQRLHPERTRPLPAPSDPPSPPDLAVSKRAGPPPGPAPSHGFTPPQPPRHSFDLSAPIASMLRDQPVQMDRKTYARMSRGRLVPDGRIDLHGMTLERAHDALNRYVLTAHAQGRRLLLVITGKGKDRDDSGPIPVRRGVLRHQVPQWLAMPPLSRVVMQVVPAHQSHGGEGAYYVYLRRQR